VLETERVRAIQFDRSGPPSVLELRTLPRPVVAADEVLVAVRAAGVNPVDAQNRADPGWARLVLPHVPGYDIAGVIEAVGAEAQEFAVGDRVMAMLPFPAGAGGYAELVAVRESLVARIPDDVDDPSAAAAPLAAGTALAVLDRFAAEAAGSTMLCLGASGAVGGYIVQLAAARGLRVIAVGRTASHERLRDLGAAACIDYATDAIAEAAGTVDVIVDLVGGSLLTSCLSALRDGGRIVAIALPDLDLDEVIDRNLTFHGVLIDADGGRTRTVARLLGEGVLRSGDLRTLPLQDAAEAHRIVESAGHSGKIVLVVDPAEA
jgi:NADPH:quinone reductase-like Zn-dependent oxidoreductase